MQEKLTLIKQIEFEVKTMVVLIDVLMTLYVLWLIITNTSTWIPGAIFGFTPFGAYELIRAGKLFHLCTAYKLMVTHTVAVYCCCIFQAEYGFGITLSYFRWIMFISGLMLAIIIILKLCKCYECSSKENDIESA